MNIPRLKKRSGFTLIEVLVGAGLLAAMVAFIAYLLISSLRAQEFERSVRTATTATREAMNRMADELRLAVALPAVGTLPDKNNSADAVGFMGANTLPSGVLLPDSYGTNVGSVYSGSGEYSVEKSRETCRSVNRLIFTRPRTEAGMSNANARSYQFNPTQLSNYVYVEWIVPRATPDRLWRRVYTITDGAVGDYRGHSARTQTGIDIGLGRRVIGVIWVLNTNFFTSRRAFNPSGAGSNDESNWLVCALNSGTTSSNFSGGELKDDSKGRGEAFVRSKATMKFTVSHPIIVNSHGGNVDPLYYTTYNRNLFRILFETTVYKGKKSGIAGNETKIKFETQVRLQAGT